MKLFLAGLVVRAAPFALLRNSRKTECVVKLFLADLVVRAAPFALLRHSRGGGAAQRSVTRLPSNGVGLVGPSVRVPAASYEIAVMVPVKVLAFTMTS